MLPLLAGAAVLAAAPFGARLVLNRGGKGKAAPSSSPATPEVKEETPLEARPPAPAEPAKPPSAAAAIVKGASTALSVGKVVAGAGAGVSAGVAAVGILAASASGQVVEKLLGQGEGRGNLAAVTGVAALPAFVTQAAVEKVGAALGMKPKLAKDIGHVAAAGPLAPAVAQLKLLNKGVEGVAKLIAGDKGVQAVKNVVHSFDPTRKDTVPGKVVGAVGGFIKNIIPVPKPSTTRKPAASSSPPKVLGIKLPNLFGKKK